MCTSSLPPISCGIGPTAVNDAGQALATGPKGLIAAVNHPGSRTANQEGDYVSSLLQN